MFYSSLMFYLSFSLSALVQCPLEADHKVLRGSSRVSPSHLTYAKLMQPSKSTLNSVGDSINVNFTFNKCFN